MTLIHCLLAGVFLMFIIPVSAYLTVKMARTGYHKAEEDKHNRLGRRVIKSARYPKQFSDN